MLSLDDYGSSVERAANGPVAHQVTAAVWPGVAGLSRVLQDLSQEQWLQLLNACVFVFTKSLMSSG